MNQQMNKCSESQLWRLLEDATSKNEITGAFLEGGPERELAYSKRSLARWDEIVRLILQLPTRNTCLDIGTSALTFVLPNFFNRIHTLDYSDAMKARCEKASVEFHSGGLAAENGKVLIPVPDENFDCIMFLEVIEHLHLNPVNILKTLKAKLKTGGTLILSTPNMMSLGNRIKMLCNKQLGHFACPPFSENEFPQHGHGHDRIYMPAEMKLYFEEAGWNDVQVGYHGMAVSDISPINGVAGLLSKVIQEPLKAAFPSLRQLMLIQARK